MSFTNAGDDQRLQWRYGQHQLDQLVEHRLDRCERWDAEPRQHLYVGALGTLDHTGGIVNVTGTLNDAGATLNVGTGTALGTLTLVSGGTIENGTIADAGSGLAFAGGTLSGVTYDGTMNLSNNSAYVYVANGLTMFGVGGTGAGTINLTGQGNELFAEGTETLNNATIDIGNNSTDYIYNYDVSAAAVLTLGSTLTIDQTGSNAQLTGYEDRIGSGIVNAGTINADFAGGTFTIGDVSFTNAGDDQRLQWRYGQHQLDRLVEHRLDRCERWDAEPRQHLYNGGAWHARSYRRHRQRDRDAERCWSDAECRHWHGAGDTDAGLWAARSRTAPLRMPGLVVAFAGGTLSGVTYDGTMNLSNNSAYVYVANGLTMAGVGGTGAGTINLTGQSNELFAEGTETLNNATINIGNNSTDYIYNYDVSAAAVLTLGSTLTIDQTGSNVQLTGYEDRIGSGIVNAGTINADFAGGTFTIGDVSFTNEGTINVSNGDTVTISSGTFANVSGGTLSRWHLRHCLADRP